MTTKSVRVESSVAWATERHHVNGPLQRCDGLYVMQRPEDSSVEQAEAAHAAGFGAPFARWMRVRSQGMPLASTFAHCAAVRRMERCSSRSSGGVGGRPRPRFCSSMAGSVNELSNHKKALAMLHLLNHNKCTDKRNGADDMATTRVNKYSDFNGATVALASITQMRNEEFRSKFPGVKGMRADGYTMWVGLPAEGAGRELLPVTRMISMKAFPTKHECNAKCLNGKHDGACECQCGGKNHGRGMFTKMLEAA